MLRKFKVEGYRNVTADVELEACTVVIGPNNSGKSNLLRAMRFATDGVVAGAADWEGIVRDHGGPAMIRWQAPHEMAVLWWSFLDDVHCRFVIVPRSVVHGTVLEWVRVNGLELANFNVEGGADDPLVGTGSIVLGDGTVGTWPDPVARSNAQEQMRLRFAQLGHLSLASLHAPTAKAASMSVRGATRLAHDARNLVAWLKEQQNHPDGLEALRAALEPLIPGLKRIFVRDVDGQAMWVEASLAARPGTAVALSDLSDGTLVAVILASLLHGPLAPRILLLDEPDLHLHPAWIRTIAKWFEAPGDGRQVILATHSSDLLDALTPGFRAGRVALLVADAQGVVRRVQPDGLTAFFDEGYELGDLYRVGEPELGGWPW